MPLPRNCAATEGSPPLFFRDRAIARFRHPTRRPCRSVRAPVALTLAVALLVGGCSGQVGDGEDNPDVPDRFEAYCDEVVAQQRPIAEAVATSADAGLILALPSFEKLQKLAPSDLADEWSVVVRRITVLRDALKDAGVDPLDYDPQKTPPTLVDDDAVAIRAAATGLLSPQTGAALQGVQQQARDVCKTSLSLP